MRHWSRGHWPRLQTVVLLTLGLVVGAGCGSEEAAVTAGSEFSSEVTAGPGQSQSEVPAQGTGVRGRITDSSGAPIELATLTVAPPPGGSGPSRLEANVTDADGQYFLPLPPGQWEVTVTAHRHQPATLSAEVPEGKPLVRDLELKPGGG